MSSGFEWWAHLASLAQFPGLGILVYIAVQAGRLVESVKGLNHRVSRLESIVIGPQAGEGD